MTPIMTYSVTRRMTSLLVLASLCLIPTHAFHVHVHRVSRADDTPDSLHSYHLAMKAGHEHHPGESVLRTVTLKSGGKRIKRTAGEHPPYDLQKDEATVDLEQNDKLYGVLLDAGSSSTKVKVYTYIPGVLPSLVPRVHLVESVRVRGPGIGSYVTTLPDVADHLRRAVDEVISHIPERLHAVTPVYIMATAGMRTLDVGAARTLLKEVQRQMANKTINPFFFRPDHVSILSGEEEAVYAWLAVNYLLGFFATNMTQADSTGVLEMGGGSLQVAFLPDGPLLQEEFQVYVGRRRFDLYAQSYLDFGSNYLTRLVRQQLADNARGGDGDGGKTKHLDSPCMLADDVSKFQDDDVSRKVVGTGDPAECERVLTQVLDPVGGLCSPTPCSIRDRYQPAVGSMGFYGISAFLYAPNNLGAIEDDQTLNITKLRRNAWKHCNRSLEQFKAESDGKADFASNDCLLGLFIPLLLTRSLGIPEDSTVVKLAKQIEGERVDWALGAMLQELSMAFMDDLETSINCRPGNTPVTPVTRKASGGSQPLRLSLTCLGPLLIVMLAVQNCL